MVKKLWRYVKPFSSDTGTLRTDRQTVGQTDRQTDRQRDLLYQYRASVCWRAIKTERLKCEVLKQKERYILHTVNVTLAKYHARIYRHYKVGERPYSSFWWWRCCWPRQHSASWRPALLRRSQPCSRGRRLRLPAPSSSPSLSRRTYAFGRTSACRARTFLRRQRVTLCRLTSSSSSASSSRHFPLGHILRFVLFHSPFEVHAAYRRHTLVPTRNLAIGNKSHLASYNILLVE